MRPMTHVVALLDYKRQNIMQTVFRATYFVKQVVIRKFEIERNVASFFACIFRLAVSVEHRIVTETDGRTNRQTHDDSC